MDACAPDLQWSLHPSPYRLDRPQQQEAIAKEALGLDPRPRFKWGTFLKLALDHHPATGPQGPDELASDIVGNGRREIIAGGGERGDLHVALLGVVALMLGEMVNETGGFADLRP